MKTKKRQEKRTIEDVIFEIYCEHGNFTMSLREIRHSDMLHSMLGRYTMPPIGRKCVYLGRHIITYPEDYLKQNKEAHDIIQEAERLYRENPLKYYIPPCQTVVDFLNWRANNLEHTMKVLHAGVGTGKSTAGCIDLLLSIVPTDEDWPIFRDFGVVHRKYRGPFTDGGVAVVSYEMKNHEYTIWPQVLKKWTPPAFLEGGGTVDPSFRRSPKITIAGTPVFFFASSQRDTTFVSQALDIIWWDEQSTEEKFNNANARVRRRGGRHIMTMTPHHIDGRKDTGAGSYVDAIRHGHMDAGVDVRFFRVAIDDVVEWVMPADDKRRMKHEWIEEPMRLNNRKKLAEGRAIVHGEFHESSGLVLDVWDRSLHVIEPFEVDDSWPRWRYHDHGRKEPNACILVAITPNNEYIIMAEHYESDREISENAQMIVETMSGNRIAIRDDGSKFEQYVRNYVLGTISDAASINKKLDDASHSIGDEYIRHGLFVQPGTTQKPYQLVPLAAQLLEPDPRLTHIRTGECGGPRLYVFSTCRNFIREIENWRMKRQRVVMGDAVGLSEKPMAKDDHLMRCLLELAAHRPSFVRIDNWRRNVDEWTVPDSRECMITAY